MRRVAPKLIANGESHALERGRPARGLRLGSHVAVKRAGNRGWRGGRRTGHGRRVTDEESARTKVHEHNMKTLTVNSKHLL